MTKKRGSSLSLLADAASERKPRRSEAAATWGTSAAVSLPAAQRGAKGRNRRSSSEEGGAPSTQSFIQRRPRGSDIYDTGSKATSFNHGKPRRSSEEHAPAAADVASRRKSRASEVTRRKARPSNAPGPHSVIDSMAEDDDEW